MIVAVCVNAAVDVTYRVAQLRVGESHRVSDVRSRAGGKGVNVARVLRQLGEPVLVCGFAGGAAGELIDADLTASGIEHRLTALAAESRRAVAVVAQDQATVFSEAGPQVGAGDWERLLADVAESCVGVEVVVLSGSLPPGAPVSGYAQLIGLARHHGALTVVDADGEVLSAAAAAAPDVVKPNETEAAALLGRPVRTRTDATESGRQLLRRGAQAAIVSRGAAGLVAVRDGEALAARLDEDVDGNPTGAGDALVAAVARGLACGATWRELLCDGVAVSAAAVAEPVAGGYDPALAARLRPHVRLEEC